MEAKIIIDLAGVIGAVGAIIATIVTARKASSKADRYDAKNSILMMIAEDHQQVMEGKLPTNYQNVLHEYDIYHANGGNSYISEKVEDYKSWFKEIQAKK